jgi:VWFA-related protein
MRKDRLTTSLAALAVVSLFAGPTLWTNGARAQEPPAGQNAPQPQVPVFSAETAAVVVDVVVRDKKGKPVKDLKASDFTITEDGAPQTVDSLRVIDNMSAAGEEAEPAAPVAAAPGAAAPAAPAAPAATTSKASAPSVIAFVFDRLTPNARKTAEKAALTYADKGYVPGDLVAVFSIDLALHTIQPFTNDVGLIKTGISRAAQQGNTQFANDREEARRRTESAMAATDTLATLGQTNQAGASIAAAQQAFDTVQVNMLRTFDSLERDQQGYATSNGLLAVVSGLKAIPGRKTVVFFSEGLALTANVQGQFRSVISSANRANVSVYAVDAGGLRTESGIKEAGDELRLASQRRASMEGRGDQAMTGGALTKGLERTEDLLRLDPSAGLGQLADETGGFLVRDTNDASPGFRRIQEDMRFYYLLSYTPSNSAFDGRYRTIGVKVSRPGVNVQTRKGYYAVRPEYVVPVRAYEAPALALLDKSPRPEAFAMKLGALSFPEKDRPGLVPVIVEIPGNTMAWAPERTGGSSHAQFAVVVRIKDAMGREADRLSQDYALSAATDKAPQVRAGSVLFYRESDLPPGRYTVEAVAYDAIAQTASTRSTGFEVVKPAPEGLRLSSLMVVSRAEKLPKEEQTGKNPLQYGEVLLYPNLGTPVKKSAGPVLGFFFSVYGKAGAAPTPANATLEIQQGTKVVAKTLTPLAPADAQGRSQNAGALPIGNVPPGSYTLRVSVADGTGVQTRDAPFVVAE